MIDVCLSNLEVRVKDGFCTLVEIDKGTMFYIQTLVPEEKGYELQDLIDESTCETDFYDGLSGLVVKSFSEKSQPQNCMEKEYPRGLILR